MICEAADAGATLRTITGVLAAVATAILLGIIGYRTVREVTGNYQPRFPS